MKKISGSFLLALLCAASNAQPPPANWQNLDLKKDSVFGMSTEKAYKELLKNKKLQTVVVAVIDGGADTSHEDLKAAIWHNPKEKLNVEDDDGNGYVDDLYGWNFIGGKAGNVHYDNLEMTRLMRRDMAFYDSLSTGVVPKQFRAGYQAYSRMKREYYDQLASAIYNASSVDQIEQYLQLMTRKIGKENPTVEDLRQYHAGSDLEKKILDLVAGDMSGSKDFTKVKKEWDDASKEYNAAAYYRLNRLYDPRYIVGDRYADGRERYYGNNDVYGPDARHGTHVAGIIGAIRNNNAGINGVAANARLMILRAVPDGDERDKDIANAIRYAADNGAKVINMSLGKAYSWNKEVVDEAVKYAASKDVLIVHAAGNDNRDLDKGDFSFFPNKYYQDGSGEAQNWITVGASVINDDATLRAGFSNYGKKHVDVFAPGVLIKSAVPGSKYENMEGTSMAAPMVAGLAALIRGCYPKLTAVQVKEIIIKSVVKVDHEVRVSNPNRVVPFSEICVSGGIVNVYNALKLAKNF